MPIPWRHPVNCTLCANAAYRYPAAGLVAAMASTVRRGRCLLALIVLPPLHFLSWRR